MIKYLQSAAVLALFATSAMADIEVRFVEGAPKDRFDIVNMGNCATGPVTITVDLSGSPAGLVFDVTARGAGVEVFQPFDLVAGRDVVVGMPNVTDGDQQVALDLTGLATDEMVSFTIDVDDTGGAREITVSGAEISGAKVKIVNASGMAEALFDTGAMARVPFSACVS